MAFTLKRTNQVLKKFINNNTFFLFKWKNIVYNENDLLLIYIYIYKAREDLCYFDEELPSKNNNSNNETENNKVDKENKENILPNDEIYIVLVKNKAV